MKKEMIMKCGATEDTMPYLECCTLLYGGRCQEEIREKRRIHNSLPINNAFEACQGD